MDERTTSPRDLLSIALAGNTYSDAGDRGPRDRRVAGPRIDQEEEQQQIAFSLRHRGTTWAEIGNVWGIIDADCACST